MNRRTFVIAIGIAIAFCLGVYFYAQWDMKRFDASLPEPAAADTVVETPTETAVEDISDAAQPAAETSAGHWHGDEWHEEPHFAAPDPPGEPTQPVVEEPRPVKEESPWRAELKRQSTESKRLLKESLAHKAEWEALQLARDANQISHEEYKQASRDLLARMNALTREMRQEAVLQEAAEAERAKGGNN